MEYLSVVDLPTGLLSERTLQVIQMALVQGDEIVKKGQRKEWSLLAGEKEKGATWVVAWR